MADLFSPAQQPQQQERNWTAYLVGLMLVLVVISITVAVTRHHRQTEEQANPYANKLQLSGLRLSAAQNYVGGTVTYLDMNITNTGDKAVTAADMKLVFKNNLGQVVQTETVPLHVLVPNQMGVYPDLVNMNRSPIAPGQVKTVRMTLEHISADWDQSYPEMQLVNLSLK